MDQETQEEIERLDRVVDNFAIEMKGGCTNRRSEGIEAGMIL
jgi:hypothetical protein